MMAVLDQPTKVSSRSYRSQEKAPKKAWNQHLAYTSVAGSEGAALAWIRMVLEEEIETAAPQKDLDETPFAWLTEIYALVKAGNPDDALDILFRQIDELLVLDQASQCEDILRSIDLQKLDSNLLVGLLSITLPIASTSTARAKVFERIERRFRLDFPSRADRLLAGLR